MPAKSEKQAIAARIARGIQKGEVEPKAGTASAEMAKMNPTSLKHFTKMEGVNTNKPVINPDDLKKIVQYLAKEAEDFQNYVGVDAPYDVSFGTIENIIKDSGKKNLQSFWNRLNDKQQMEVYNMIHQFLVNKEIKRDPEYFGDEKVQPINYTLSPKPTGKAPSGENLDKLVKFLAKKSADMMNYVGLDSPEQIQFDQFTDVIEMDVKDQKIKKLWDSMNSKQQEKLYNKVVDVLEKKYGSGEDDEMYESIKLSNIAKGMLEEARKKKTLKKEADEKKPEEDVADEPPQLGGEDETNKQTPPAPENPPAKDAKVAGLGDVNPAEQGKDAGKNQETPKADTGDETSNVEKVKADAVKAKAELEKAKAEKDQAEKEIEQQAHVKLVSKAGVSFLLSKLLGDAVEKNSLDALAGEMVDKLKIQNPEDFEIFSNEMTPFKAMPGVAQLLSSMKTLSSSQPQGTETEK